MALEKNRGRRIETGELAVVVGAGRSGLAAARLLRRAGARVRLLDSNLKALAGREVLAAELAALGIDVQLGEHSAAQFAGAAFVVPSPGMSPAQNSFLYLAKYWAGFCASAEMCLDRKSVV